MSYYTDILFQQYTERWRGTHADLVIIPVPVIYTVNQ